MRISSKVIRSEIEITVDTKEPAYRIVESTIIRGSVVLLHIARVEVVQHVIHAKTCPELYAVIPEREVHRVLKLGVEGQEGWKQPCSVFTADKIPIAINP